MTKLVDSKTNKEIVYGDIRHTLNSNMPVKVVSFSPTRKIGGLVRVQFESDKTYQEYYPFVIGAKFIEVDDE